MPPDLDDYRRAAARLFYRKADLEVGDDVLGSLAERRASAAEAARAQVASESARALGARTCTADPVPGGTLHAVFRLRADGRAYYARISLPDLPAPAGELLVDRIASEAAGRAGVPVAAVRHVDLTRSRVPFDLAILDAAPGDALPPDDAGDAARGALGRTLAALHGIDAGGWGPLDPGARAPRGLSASWRDFVLQRLDPHLAECLAAGALDAPAADAVRTLFRDAEPVLGSAPAVLCHGDLARPNVLVEGDRVTALLDWEDALAGDPLFDLAGWGTFVGQHERRARLWDAYAAAAALPDDAELRYWLYYVRIILAKTVHRRRFGYAAADHIPAADRIRPALAALRAAGGAGA